MQCKLRFPLLQHMISISWYTQYVPRPGPSSPRRFWPLPRPAPHCGEGGGPRPAPSRRFFALPPPPPHHPDRLQLTPLGAFSPQPLPTSCALIGSPVVLAEDGSTNQKPPFRPHNGLAEAIVWTCLMKVLSSGNLGVVARIGLCRIFWAPTGVLAGWGLGEIKAPPFSRASQTDSTLKIFKPAKLKHLSQNCDHYQTVPKFKLKTQIQKLSWVIWEWESYIPAKIQHALPWISQICP